MKPYLEKLLTRSRESFKELKKTDIQKRNDALLAIVEALEEKTAIILDANIKDVINARATGMNSSLLDRLSLSENRIMDMAQNVRKIIELPDPIGNILETTQLEYGTKIEKISEPLGVIAMIYEARPSFTVDAAALAIKSGNGCVLRGGKETLKTNMMLSEIIREAIADHIPADSVLFIEDTDYSIVEMLLTAQKKVDLIIPRGSTRLMDLVHAEARVPVLLAGPGICTAYIGETADLKKAMAVVISGKTQRPSVCNALENLLVHEKIAAKFIPMLYDKLKQKKTELRGDETIVQLTGCTPATPEDFD
ncbi:MAG: glutamate-5-semialdehyde dehydrogenase, partial [Clostridium sp.]|nr:glutamate-5-semialdehyde dehydrogenase [Clostridium sp.]